MTTFHKLLKAGLFGAVLLACQGAAAQGAKPAAAPPAGAHPASVQAGKQVFQRWCVSCHGAGPGHPGTTALDALYQGAVPAVLEEGTSLDATAIAYFVRNGRSTMPTFRKSEISDRELADLAAYLMSSKKTRPANE